MRKSGRNKKGIKNLSFGWGHQNFVILGGKKVPIAKAAQLLGGYTVAKTSTPKE